MFLPNAENAEVPEDKVRNYLLSSTHRTGASKAAFFRLFGFDPDRWNVLAEGLKRLARENEVQVAVPTPFGTRYVVDGSLLAPDGSLLNVRTAWFISRGQSAPSFVTAHPLKRKTE